MTFVKVDIKPEDCNDKNDQCQELAKKGLCLKDFQKMLKNCPWSCRFCAKKGKKGEKSTA